MADNLPAVRQPASAAVIEGRATDVTPHARPAARPARSPRSAPADVPRGTRRREPLYTQAVPRPRGMLGGLSSPQRVLLVAWAVAVGLRAFQDVRLTHDWPCPGPILRISALYLMLGVLSEPAPTLAAWLGVGLLVAYVTRVGGAEAAKQGTFFGVPVSKP